MGKPERWFSKERLAAKFRDCCDTAIERPLAEEIFALAQALDQSPSFSPLIDALGPEVEGEPFAEHSVELQLPFLTTALPGVPVVEASPMSGRSSG